MFGQHDSGFAGFDTQRHVSLLPCSPFKFFVLKDSNDDLMHSVHELLILIAPPGHPRGKTEDPIHDGSCPYRGSFLCPLVTIS